ncbi:translation initiation factor 2 [Cellulomonas sp. DKR-3]|uniref:Translation initiation factor 2 n=1 Tax=Cellulomonas fulva TaxID=2835530 RepID=A0ABS5U0H6_9CELL|nr:translation initiation factor 2 [Cellulomonas fulva]MBT0994908.1 translation initiation factor 2 [Cellulomonas fulva]
MSEHDDAQHKLADARRQATQELFKQGTPDYDQRAHQRAVEAERKAAEAAEPHEG